MSTDVTHLGAGEEETEGCEECTSHRIGRRGFLGGAAGLTALGMTGGFSALGNMQVAYADADPSYNNNTLVVVSIRGGFDGLSAVMPMGDPYYVGANSIRPTVGLQTNQPGLIPLGTSIFSMHPALSSLQSLWNAGSLAFVHDVGQEDPTMSHFDAEALMEQAWPNRPNSSGWIQRAATQTGDPSTAFAEVSIGPSQAPASTYGSYPATAMQSLSSFKLQGTPDTNNPLASWALALEGLQAGGSSYVTRPAKNALAALTQVTTLPAAGSGYPTNTDLANSLKDLARLIKAGGVRMAAVDSNGTNYRGWDMHVGMGAGGDQNGWIFTNLQALGQSLAAFMADLGPAAANVTVVTMSEFGRRAYENDSQGLDHGHGNLMMVMGGGVNGKQVLGNWRGLQPYNRANTSLSGLDINGNLPGTNDYRTVIAEILSKRLDFRAADIQAVFPKSGKVDPMANWLNIATQA